MEKSQNCREAVTESHGSWTIGKIARLPHHQHLLMSSSFRYTKKSFRLSPNLEIGLFEYALCSHWGGLCKTSIESVGSMMALHNAHECDDSAGS